MSIVDLSVVDPMRSLASAQILRISAIIFLQCTLSTADALADNSLYSKSYALVVGIRHYERQKQWRELTYADKDALAIGKFLEDQGFNVEYRLNENAKRSDIISYLEDELAPRLDKGERVLFFFSGHGETRQYGGEDYGYLVPYDGAASAATWISMEELRSLSNKMGGATHQFFIMDSCYGGAFAKKAGYNSLPEDRPNYIRAVIERTARQYLTAGGEDQPVLASGPKGYSYFTGFLLEALHEGLGDLNGDGYITASEVVAYLEDRASNEYQTPGYGTLPEHALGNFVFVSPRGPAVAEVPQEPREAPPFPEFGLKGTLELESIEEQHELTAGVKVRKQPSSLAAEVAVLAKGTPVWVAGKVKSQDWYLIEYEGTRGYVFGTGLGTVGSKQSPEPEPAVAPGREPEEIIEYYRRKANIPPTADVTLIELKPSGIQGAKKGVLDVEGRKVAFMMSNDGRLVSFGDLEDITVNPFDQVAAKINLKGSPARGPVDAEITIVGYTDFQCPFCARAKKTIDEVLREYPNKVRYIHKNFPLTFHKWAEPAAIAAACAAEQDVDAFWKLHDYFFENQSAITPENVNDRARTVLTGNGVDVREWGNCVDQNKTHEQIKADMDEGKSVDVTGTPSFYVNGRKISGAQPFQNFKTVIDSELQPAQ